MKQQRHAWSSGPGEVDDSPQLGITQDSAGVSQVAGDEDHVGQAVKISAATCENNRVIINVRDPGAGIVLPDKLMDIASGGEARSYVNELRYTGLCGKEADRVLEEFPVLHGGQRDSRRVP